ncbi:MAG: glycine cleavage system protein GcvH [Nitrospiria bacterium]
MIPEKLYYHKEHEWVRVEGKQATLGISDFAQEALGDIVYLEIPEVGMEVQCGEEVTEIESTKTTSPLYAPVSGKIVSVNQSLVDHPEWLNDDPYGEGWILVIEMNASKDLEGLMLPDVYKEFLENEKH